MPKVKMLVNTYFGAPLKKGQVTDVDDETAKRWHTNHIAAMKKSDVEKLMGKEAADKDNTDNTENTEDADGGKSGEEE